MELDRKTIAGMVTVMLMGGAGGGGIMDSVNDRDHEADLAHERQTLEIRIAAAREERLEAATACREAREAQATTFSASYEALNLVCIERCR